jgi:hypothetical protein
MKTETIEIAVRERVLWVGAEAYPLHNIARVSTAELVYRKGRAVARFIGFLLLWVFLGIFALVALFVGGVLDTDEQTSAATRAVATIVGIILLILFIRLLILLSRRKLWALVIETAGTSHRALVSRDRALLDGLVQRIVFAINNPTAPAAQFHQTINNYVSGSQYNAGGDQYNASGRATGRVG